MSDDCLRMIPLGGLGEIGMNCFVLEWRDQLVLIDCGIQFPDSSYPGVELLAPDFSYVKERIDHLRGIVVTHGHDDHIGAIPFLAREADLDVYCTAFPKGLITQKLSEHSNLCEVRFHEIAPRKMFSVGPFKFDPIPVAHSIIEALAFGIETPVGNLIHSGDFKHDPNELGGETFGFGAFEEWAQRGVLCLLSDSTNAERTGHTLSESDIARSFENILSRQTGRILIALFASNIRRIENLLWLAHRLGKKVAFAGRSMHSYTKLSHDQGSLKIPPETLVLLENMGEVADDRLIILATGSQAEPQSALLRIAQGVHKDVQIRLGDLVILSSRFIPGNERSITFMIDHLYRAGADVLYENIHQIHVSGHGFQDELLMMLNAAKPRFFVPIHGEYRHLAKHAVLAKSAGVPKENIFVIEDGQVVELTTDGISRKEILPLQKTAIVEGSVIEGNAALFTQRLNLGKTGIVFVALVRDRQTLDLVADPKVTAYGVIYRRGEVVEEVMEEAVDFVEDVYDEHAADRDLDDVIRLETRRFFKKRVSHKPVVIPMILEI
jgi:ribonuclease J